MDELDKKIMMQLQREGRASMRDIAKAVGTSAVTVLKRTKILEKQKVIKGYSCNLDYDQLGYDLPALIHVSIAKGRLLEIEEKIAHYPNVFAIYDVTGEFDAAILARFRNRKALDSFIKKIQAFPYVNKTQTNLILNIIKESAVTDL
jgi:Lrp/AsnC family transcriptional regulator, regulator for asnA, asnC and gidA